VLAVEKEVDFDGTGARERKDPERQGTDYRAHSKG